MNTDPLADCFSRLRNGAKARRESVSMPHSKMKEQVLKVLSKEGYLGDVHTQEVGPGKKNLVAQLRFDSAGLPVLEHIRKISKPGHRIYGKTPTPGAIRSGLGFQILSTSQGIMTDKQAAEKKVGGEIIGEVW